MLSVPLSRVDETFVGGKNYNRHPDKKHHVRGGSDKEIVIGAVARKGTVVARVIANTHASKLHAFVMASVSDKAPLLCRDQYSGYEALGKTYPHGSVDHANGQYVVDAIYAQDIEGFWSILKSSVVGIFHKVSAKYLSLYIAEFQLPHNNRNNEAIFGAAVRSC